MYGEFFKAVVQEVGMKRALALHAKLGEPFGVQIGEALKQKFENKKPDTESLKAIFPAHVYELWSLYEPYIRI